ncbi:MAG TPA: hypothetical protein VGM16_01420 [Gammaproteobacteria bacterium]|jgi:hypothetical protein
MSLKTDTDLVTVATYLFPWQAHIACGRLQVEEILAFVNHEHHIRMNWNLAVALGGVKLQVPARSCIEAKQILAALEAGEYDGLLDDYEPIYESGPCPSCGSKEVKPVFSLDGLFLMFGMVFFIGLLLPVYRNQLRCNNGHRWPR